MAAVERGAELIEIDVRSTRDGFLVCYHDEHLPNGLAVRDVSRDDVGSLMSWSEFVALLNESDPNRRTGVHLDLKDVGYELLAVDPLITTHRPFFVTSLEKQSIQLLRQERPDEDAFLTVGRDRGSRSRWSRWWLRASEIFPYVNVMSTKATGVAIHHSLLRPRLVRWLRRRNLRVVVWTAAGILLVTGPQLVVDRGWPLFEPNRWPPVLVAKIFFVGLLFITVDRKSTRLNSSH